jgi:hypothetical protein
MAVPQCIKAATETAAMNLKCNHFTVPHSLRWSSEDAYELYNSRLTILDRSIRNVYNLVSPSSWSCCNFIRPLAVTKEHNLHCKNSMPQKTVNCLVKCTLKYVRNFLYYWTNLQKLFQMRCFMVKAQLTTLWYRSTNWLVALNLNVPVNVTECFTLADFWDTLHFFFFSFFSVSSYIDGLWPLACTHSELILKLDLKTLAEGSAHQKAANYIGENKPRINADIHVSSGIRTHDPSVWEGERRAFVHLTPRPLCIYLYKIPQYNSSH